MLNELVLEYIREKGLRYGTLAEVDGVLGLAQNEIRRRLVAPYEDRKCEENGDVGFEELLAGDRPRIRGDGTSTAIGLADIGVRLDQRSFGERDSHGVPLAGDSTDGNASCGNVGT